MKYLRSITVLCESCGTELPIADGTTVTREVWDASGDSLTRATCIAGESGQPVPVQTALWFALDTGWSALTERALDGTFRRITSVDELDGIAARKLTVVCPTCATDVVPRLSRAAQKSIDEAADGERSLLERIARLEGQVAVLAGMRSEVAS